MSAPEILFWTASALVGWHHAGYPLALRLIARRTKARPRPAPLPDDRLPTVTLIVPAYNEAAVIGEKLRNLAALDYPAGRLTVVLACDGCRDATPAIARASGLFDDPAGRFVLADFPVNRGKVAVLNETIAAATGEIVALTDASAMLEPDALRRAVAHFADPAVGVVCPTYRVDRSENAGERAYWAHQVQVKADEAAVAAPMGAHGAFYLFRRAAWTPLPADTVNDDFVLPLAIVRDGFEAVYDRTIASSEREGTAAAPQEIRRRMRIGAGNLQQAVRLAGLADPRRPGLAFVFLSGKGLRPFVPFLILAAILSAGAAAVEGSAVFAAVFVLGIAGLAAGALAARLPPGRAPRVLALLGYFVLGHAASAAGALMFAAGRHRKVWRDSTAAKPTA
jgi:cellulose synthase/poly-beta-1,6-N-acetylglucosamine synthase-like glycosyltransferase